jgi:hypothetical protein
MHSESVNRASAIGLAILSLVALATVAAGYILDPQPQADEGALAHIFQLSIGALLPVGLVFLGSADWTQPGRVARRLSLPAAAVVLAFAALYYLEHVYQAARK